MSSDADESEPVTPWAVAAYIHEIAAGMAVAARDAGLDDIADSLAQAEAQAAAVLKRVNGGGGPRRKRRPD